jgi:hypothetical protein
MILKNGADLSANADVCVVGAGPVGLALAFRCASNGLSVTVIEAGTDSRRHKTPERDALEIESKHHASIDLISARGIGGTSRLWGGRCVKLDDIDFEKRRHVPFSGWPISHAEISSYYDEALTFLGCGVEASSSSPTEPESQAEVTTTVIERSSARPRLRELHSRRLQQSHRIKIFTECEAQEVKLDPTGERVTSLIVERNGEFHTVKATVFVLACGGLENARLLMATQRRWPRKFGGPDGALGRFYTGHLTGYLARICFEDGAFAEQFRFMRDGRGSHRRRRFSLSYEAQISGEYLNTAFWPESHSVADPAHGSGALSMAYLGLSSLRIYKPLRRGLAPSFGGPDVDIVRQHWSNVKSDRSLFRNSIAISADLLRNRFGTRAYSLANPQHRYLLRYHAEQVPDPSNMVRLKNGPGECPNAPLKVDYSFRPQDTESVVKSHDLLDRWLRRNRLGYLEYLCPPEDRRDLVLGQAIDGYHQIGLTRMSPGGREGVVDADCRVHDVGNLFVAGSSVFPTAGQANPTLPAVAVAMRLGDHLAKMPG